MPDRDATAESSPARNEQPKPLATTSDYFLSDQLVIEQPVKGYRAGIDAVLLAATARNGEGPLLDIGAGVGTVGLCAAVRCADIAVTLLERQPELAALARKNIDVNGLAARVSVVEADLCQPLPTAAREHLRDARFAHVVANPPFHDEGKGTPAHWPLKAVAHAMTSDRIELWSKFMARMAEPGGRATMIHKAEALPRILASFENRFGAITICPIHPRAGAPAIRILVDGIKGSRAPMKIAPALILHGDGNAFLPEVDTILRQGAALGVIDR